jgi:hypothetical protein
VTSLRTFICSSVWRLVCVCGHVDATCCAVVWSECVVWHEFCEACCDGTQIIHVRLLTGSAGLSTTFFVLSKHLLDERVSGSAAFGWCVHGMHVLSCMALCMAVCMASMALRKKTRWQRLTRHCAANN